MNVSYQLGSSHNDSPVCVGPIIIQWVSDLLVTDIDLTANQNQGAIDCARSVHINYIPKFRIGNAFSVILTLGTGQQVLSLFPPTFASLSQAQFNILQPNPIRFGVQLNSFGFGFAGQVELTINNFFVRSQIIGGV